MAGTTSRLWPLVAVLFGALACEDDVPLAELGDGCLINSDCSSPLVCAFQRCHEQCEDSRDCSPGLNCVVSDRPYRVCQLDDERTCSATPDCPGDQVCAIDNVCRDGCLGAVDCIPEQQCVSGTCAEPSELVEGKLPSTASGSPEGQPCVYHSDCVDPLLCVAGQCRYECKEDRDCAGGASCADGVCVPAGSGGAGGSGGGGQLPPGYGEPCNLQSDCSPFGLICGLGGECVYQCNEDVDCPLVGTCCLQHSCVVGPACEGVGGGGGSGGQGGGGQGGGTVGNPCGANDHCDDGLWCNGPELCVVGSCAPAADTPCNSHSSCVIDTCTEPVAPMVVGTCVHTPVAGEDVDGDGHLSLGCAGGDDCDDGDPEVNPEVPESCDGKDNDCDGMIDDFTLKPAAAEVALPPSFTTWGAPHVVPLDTDDHLVVTSDGSLFDVRVLDAQGGNVAGPVTFPAGSYATLSRGPDHAMMFSHFGLPLAAKRLSTSGTSLVHTAPTNIALRTDSTPVAAAWTGVYHVVAFDLSATTGHYAMLDPAGTLVSGVQAVASGPGGPIGTGKMRVAHAGDTTLVLYVRADFTGVDATVLHPNMGNFSPAATVSLPQLSPVPTADFELVGLGDEFYLVWSDFSVAPTIARFEIDAANQIVMLPVDPIPSVAYSSWSLATDQLGVALLGSATSVTELIYFRPDLGNPAEITYFPVLSCDSFARVTAGPARLDVGCANVWRAFGCL